MPDLRTTDPGSLVLALLLIAQTAALSGPPAFAAASFDPLVQDGIRRGAYPGAALVVGRHDTT